MALRGAALWEAAEMGIRRVAAAVFLSFTVLFVLPLFARSSSLVADLARFVCPERSGLRTDLPFRSCFAGKSIFLSLEECDGRVLGGEGIGGVGVAQDGAACSVEGVLAQARAIFAASFDASACGQIKEFLTLMEPIPGTAQEGSPAALLPLPLAVRIRKIRPDSIEPVGGKKVRFIYLSGPPGVTRIQFDGVAIGPGEDRVVVTDSNGLASISMTLGDQPGVYLVRATRGASCPSINFVLTAKQALRLQIVQIDPPEVRPSDGAVSQGKDTATVTVKLTDEGRPVVAETILLEVEAEQGSGGHAHDGNRPAGAILPGSCRTEVDGTCSNSYQAPPFGGITTVKAQMAKDASVKAEPKEIPICVPNLGGLGPGISYRLTGQTTAHPDNHHGAVETLEAIIAIAQAYLENPPPGKPAATLGINDISLECGGLFDIGPPEGSFWSAPHSLHRVGKSVDINTMAEVVGEPGKKVPVVRDWLEDLVGNSGRLVPEKTIHIEFGR